MLQVRKLQSYSSIVLWAGNNENEAALVQDWYGTDADWDKYRRDYLNLYQNTIEATVRVEDPHRAFVLSSPSNGVIATQQAGGINSNPTDSLFGDIHVYSYYSDGWSPSSYPQGPRFVSEYGWQSFPKYLSQC